MIIKALLTALLLSTLLMSEQIQYGADTYNSDTIELCMRSKFGDKNHYDFKITLLDLNTSIDKTFKLIGHTNDLSCVSYPIVKNNTYKIIYYNNNHVIGEYREKFPRVY